MHTKPRQNKIYVTTRLNATRANFPATRLHIPPRCFSVIHNKTWRRHCACWQFCRLSTLAGLTRPPPARPRYRRRAGRTVFREVAALSRGARRRGACGAKLLTTDPRGVSTTTMDQVLCFMIIFYELRVEKVIFFKQIVTKNITWKQIKKVLII